MPGFVPPSLPLLVFTDLDGTLLDHHDYSFEPALPALRRLRELGIPVIATTSKTLAELETLSEALALPYPCIVENGSALCVPKNYFSQLDKVTTVDGYELIRLGPDYDALLQHLEILRREHGFRFRGFHDMSPEALAADTGLSLADAVRARQRLCSEPLIWQDTEQALDDFASRLQAFGLTLTRGGRYWHVMGPQNKATAMRQMQTLYETQAGHEFTVIALGDSPNDLEMLSAADIGVIIPRPDGSHLDCKAGLHTLKARACGPEGWNDSMQWILDDWIKARGEAMKRVRSGH